MEARSSDVDPAEVVAQQLTDLIEQVEELIEEVMPPRSCDQEVEGS